MAVSARDLFDQLNKVCTKDELRVIGKVIDKVLTAHDAATKQKRG